MSREHRERTDGSPALAELLESSAAPRHWFAAHRHCHFVASTPKGTCFTALGQTLPGCKFLTFFELPGTFMGDPCSEIELDPQWLCYLQRHFSVHRKYIPPVTLATLKRLFHDMQQTCETEATSGAEDQEFPRNAQTMHILEQIGIPWESVSFSTKQSSVRGVLR
jgi:hypothetical protein